LSVAGPGAARAWQALAALLAAGALIGFWLPREALAWQADHPWQAWRWWTAAFVHWSRWHLVANLAGLALVAALGSVAALPARAALAWLLAWPFTHLALLARPDLAQYGGLSGVLHAGVVIAAWQLLRGPTGRPRTVGWALLAGVAAKLLLEAPWGPALRHPPDWDIAIAPLAHATGAVAGLAAALLLTRPNRKLTR
jgi:rhomboid family GlyGly-CTERM serine protease